MTLQKSIEEYLKTWENDQDLLGEENYQNNIVITMMYGTRWAPKILGGTLCKVHICLTTMLHT